MYELEEVQVRDVQERKTASVLNTRLLEELNQTITGTLEPFLGASTDHITSCVKTPDFKLALKVSIANSLLCLGRVFCLFVCL